MGRRRLLFGVTLAVTVMVGPVPTATVGAQEPEIRVDLDGRPIEPAQASTYYCHDFDFPDIHCFSTREGLEEATGDSGRTRPSARSSDVNLAMAAAVAPADYVTIYSGASYSGTFAHLSQNYDALAVIGWNDTISSYRGRNNKSGRFYEHWFAGGAIKRFCCNQNVPSLAAGVDDTFSSVYQG